MKYTMYKYDARTDLWHVHAKLANKEDLLLFLSYGTNTYNGLSRHRWTNRFIDEQNLTGKDIITSSAWVKVYDENGTVKCNQFGPLYELERYRNIREWHLEDEYGRTVDMTIFKDEVYDMVENMSFYLRNTLYMRNYKSKKKKVRQGRSHHHAFHYRYSPKNHRYGRTLKTVEEPAEDVEEFLTDHQMRTLEVKPKDMYAKFTWSDDFWRSGPSGWKEHKNAKQWEAKQKRTDAVWVANEDKRKIDVEHIYFDEDEDLTTA